MNISGVKRSAFYKSLFISAGSIGLSLFCSVSSAETLGAIGTYQANTAEGLYTGIYDFLMLAGLLLVAFGLFSWRQAHKRGESLAPAIGEIVIGILLTSIVAVIDMGSSTVFNGSNNSKLSVLQGSSSS